jgi:prepilin peptidase CpaA
VATAAGISGGRSLLWGDQKMLGTVLLFAPFVLLLVLAAGWDLASYTIPNFIPVLLLVAFFLLALSTGLTPATIGNHAAAAGIGLLAGFILFALRYIGGGDAKLFACIGLWFGLHDLTEYVLVASLFGGALTVFLLTARRWPLPSVAASQTWIARLHEPSSGIPYGVALAAGALAILPYAEVFRSAAG